ncbi:MAG: hypothetical protein ACRCZF_00300, partial [Gemmataceae bacterium]
MAKIACPSCRAHVGIPDETSTGTPFGCPVCGEEFLSPELPKLKDIPTKKLNGRTDYLDANDFTKHQGKKARERQADEPDPNPVVTIIC